MPIPENFAEVLERFAECNKISIKPSGEGKKKSAVPCEAKPGQKSSAGPQHKA